MSKYIIKSNKYKVDGFKQDNYNHDFCDDKGNIINDNIILKNGKRAHDVLFYFGSIIEPFMKNNKIKSLETKMEEEE
jgi:hypothetical protein